MHCIKNDCNTCPISRTLRQCNLNPTLKALLTNLDCNDFIKVWQILSTHAKSSDRESIEFSSSSIETYKKKLRNGYILELKQSGMNYRQISDYLKNIGITITPRQVSRVANDG